MRYVDAGYVIALGALALYAMALVVRRRRAERAARAWAGADRTPRVPVETESGAAAPERS